MVSLGATTATLVYGLLWTALVVVGSDLAWCCCCSGMISLPVFVAGMCWYWIRLYYLPVPALMLEPIGVFEAIGRGYRLTARQFWRTFGIAALTWLIATFAGSLLTTPVSLIGQLTASAVPRMPDAVLTATNPSPTSSSTPSSPPSSPRSPRCSTWTSGCARRPTTWS